jgi:hypothetical protein
MCGKRWLITARSVGGGLGYVREISVVDTNVLKEHHYNVLHHCILEQEQEHQGF